MSALYDITGLIVQVMLPLTILVAAGAIWPRVFPDVDSVSLRLHLHRLTLYLFYPCIIFSVGAATPVSLDLLAVPLLVALGTLIGGGVLYLLLYRTALGAGLSRPTRAVLLIGGMFGNTFNIGAPTLAYFFGPDAIRYAVYNDMLMTMPLVWSLGVWICTRLGQDNTRANHPPVWRVMLRMPPIWAFFAGIAYQLAGPGFPPLIEATRMIGQATIPVVLFVLGMTIPWTNLVPRRELFAVAVVKLVLMPLVVWVLATVLFGQRAEPQLAAVVEAAMPAMMTTLILAGRFHLDEGAAALVIGWTTLLYWITLPVLLASGLFR